MKIAFLAVLSCAALTIPAQAAKPTPHVWPELGVEISIPFPDYGAIHTFEADGQNGLWLQDRQRRWYYATIQGAGCQSLNFAQFIGYDTRGSRTFDRYSSIRVGDWDCPIESLVTSEKPLPRKERERRRKVANAAGRQVVAPAN